MSLQPVTYYQVKCDETGCDRTTEAMVGSPNAARPDAEHALDQWVYAGGYNDLPTGQQFCSHHWPELCFSCKKWATGADVDGDPACDEHQTPALPAAPDSSPEAAGVPPTAAPGEPSTEAVAQ